ncbi:hypothetical protein MJL27_27820, partial [Salmonella enterica subsp. enterica serovar Anatum]|nr:hypothetical protein [Salmonella enterica subsp. enterica serovar Anatum]
LINVGGGIPVPYKYDDENGDPLKDNMYAGITAQDFADAVIREDLNENAPRAMAVIDPVKLVIENYPQGESEMVTMPNHPNK